MKKLAIFVEGQTEQLFFQEFIEQIAGQGNISFQSHTVGTLLRLTQTVPIQNETHHVLIYDCRGDEAVKSAVLDQRPSLISAGYSLILGVRDLYPEPLTAIGAIKARLSYGVPTAGVPTRILLAVAEVEAWFLQEQNHFSRIDASLDVSDFKTKFGFDPSTDCAELVPQPAQLLHQIYSSTGKAYKKTRKHVQRTVGVIDYENLYLACVPRMPHLTEFVGQLENFLAPDLL